MTLRWVPGWNGLTEPEAVSYVAAVEAADGEPLEFGVAKAINDFVLGCKQDKIWDAIKACCILAGARTLDGALVPLVGAAPTNNNFVDADYDRETGLVGDGSTKYLDSNRNNNADPQNDGHVAVFATELGSAGRWVNTENLTQAGIYTIAYTGSSFNLRNRTSAADSGIGTPSTNSLTGLSRSISSTYTFRSNGATISINRNSDGLTSGNTYIYSGGGGYTNPRLAFYSIGESLDLAALDTRVSNLITAIGAAIP